MAADVFSFLKTSATFPLYMYDNTERYSLQMAIYHCSIKIISRGKGKSAVAAAAYRSGELIKNEYDGIIHDYTRKGGVVHTEILLPEYAPEKYANRKVLWNAVEKIERAKNSQLAREIELALPAELTLKQNNSLVRDYVYQHFVKSGMCADICVHDKGDGNPHAHIMLTMRPFERDGTWGAKAHKVNGQKISTIDWNDRTKAEVWREAWAQAVNSVLEQQKRTERIDHRSYVRQGIDKVPTVHLGVAASQMERKGIRTKRGNMNREIFITNKQLTELQMKISELKTWLQEAVASTEPATLADIVQAVLDSGKFRNQRLQQSDMKLAEQAVTFLQENNIFTLPELRKMVAKMFSRIEELRDVLRLNEARVGTLDEHFRQAERYMEHRDLYAEYQNLKPRKQAKFFEVHRAEIMVFESAERHFDEHGISEKFPIDAWKQEREELIAGRGSVYREYAALNGEVQEVEAIRRVAEKVVREINIPQQQRKAREWDLEGLCRY